ncbi:MAG: alkaline phosphatase family protein [Bacteroidetes bacterium]|nr:alkaline phosphatase family protein [Bacteroidota bacterium]
MKKTSIFIFLIFILTSTFSKKTEKEISINDRPKLVVGIVIDQMRWDYLYRFYDRYTDGGFKRLMREGFSCENTLIPYYPTVTAAGHASIFTGSVPAINGIVGNDWYDYDQQRSVYCTEDTSVQSVGVDSKKGEMSPKNLLVTTIGDELKLATNFRSKVIGISMKDRGAILPAGHSADASYWYDKKTGNFITSTYYMKKLPQWVVDFDAPKRVMDYYKKDWNTLYPIETYVQSDSDINTYEYEEFNGQKGFPYDLKHYIKENNYDIFFSTPYGNSLTFEFAKTAVQQEQLGLDSITDMLTVSISSTDYIGHSFGPNSIEAEDTYLRLDKDLASFLHYLDEKVGANNYTLFLTADHGAAHVPGFLEKHKLPNGNVSSSDAKKALNVFLKEKFGYDSLIIACFKSQYYLNFNAIEQHNLDRDEIVKVAIQFLKKIDNIDRVVDYTKIQEATIPAPVREQFTNGYNSHRCGDILAILKPGYLDTKYKTGTQHSVWNPYDAHIPLLFYGYGINKGKTYTKTYMTDIAPTITSLLHIQMPSGCIGNTINKAIIK